MYTKEEKTDLHLAGLLIGGCVGFGFGIIFCLIIGILYS